jgi:hypothetical protein
MITAEQIPDEVVKEALWAYNYASRDCYTTEEQDIAIAIAAALNAWEGAIPTSATDHLLVARPALVLPLPKEGE